MTVILAQRENPLIEISAILTQCDRALKQVLEFARLVFPQWREVVTEPGSGREWCDSIDRRKGEFPLSVRDSALEILR